MSSQILDDFHEQKYSRFAKLSFVFLVLGICAYFVSIGIVNFSFSEENYNNNFDYYFNLQLIFGLVFHVPGFVTGILSFAKNEGSVLRRYLGLFGNAILMLFAATMLFA